ncbi:MAG: riboflavin synthase [Acidimicrobiales bacterium]|jgi:3,4-dihydroxy 2-butanone 4-phosphate synthase/3,4-dihydroxy 2-butanone 4-phosphate synthase/GTP cyclohydrolase II
MFTGRIRQIGVVTAIDDTRLHVQAPKVASTLEEGSSVAVAGVCLTAAAIDPEGFAAALSLETRRRSTLGDLDVGACVNLEPALQVGSALDGHLVQGHVDGTGKVARIDVEGIGRRLWIRTSSHVMSELVPKGSVAVDGVSLTVAETGKDRFCVALIPTTLAETTLSTLEVGQRVNLETDLVAKLARHNNGATGAALAAVIGTLPWAGPLSGRLGVEKAVAQIASGGGVVVWDPTREHEGDVVFAGARLRPEAMVFLLTHACGHTTVPCDRARLDRLEIPRLAGAGDRHGTAPHLPIDLAAGTGTGVSAPERAATIRRLANPDAVPGDFLRPGHVFPLAARAGGLRERGGHTEASIALCEAAGLPTVAVICEVMGPDGVMAGGAELERFALRWGLPVVDVADLTAWL